ncbi:DUF4124 domain-containing protein [Microbulbifer taiwanensis]|uniref:DUF4124 domain-containing protein n=1 Tax=Microbulbifer taiwanensis TaxID=986746 RepID=A0ABW1YQQ1_9GAMM|nr:DUF4124 domain-containing protein [Microbulbifer taiwanensis]
MKTTYMLAVLLLVGIGLPMLLPGPDGEPIMSPRDWLPSQETLDSAQRQTERAWQTARSTTQKSGELLQYLAGAPGTAQPGESAQPGSNAVYKWQDSDGNWHFSDKAPEDLGAVVQSHEIKQLNTLPAVQVQPAETEEVEQPSEMALPSPTTISPKQISQLIEDAKALQQKAKARQQALDEL